jgi:hypothetical protein
VPLQQDYRPIAPGQPLNILLFSAEVVFLLLLAALMFNPKT